MKRIFTILVVIAMLSALFVPAALADNGPEFNNGTRASFVMVDEAEGLFRIDFRAFGNPGNAFVFHLEYDSTLMELVAPDGSAILVSGDAMQAAMMRDFDNTIVGDARHDDLASGWARASVTDESRPQFLPAAGLERVILIFTTYPQLPSAANRMIDWGFYMWNDNSFRNNFVAIPPAEGLLLYSLYFRKLSGVEWNEINEDAFDSYPAGTDAPLTGVSTITPISCIINGNIVGQDVEWVGFNVSLRPNPPVISNVTVGNDYRATVTGTGVPGATVNVTITDDDGDVVASGTATVGENGNWTFTTTDPLPDGSYTAGATQTTAGGTSNGSNEVDFDVERDTNRPEPPTVDVTVEDDYSVTASGTGEPGATVNVVIRDEDGEDVANGEVIVDEDGNWTFTTTGPLPDGDYTASVNQTVDGSTSEDAEEDFTVERDPGNGGQIVFTIASPTNGQSFVVGNSVVVQGTGHPGASVLVRINQQTGGALVVQHNITVGANGNWTTTFGGLAISNYVAVATQTVGDDEFGPLSRNFSIVASNNNNNNNNNNTWNPNRPGGGGPTFIGGGTTPANENLLFVVGFPDGDFRPDAPITRAEIAAMGSRIHFTQIGQNDANFPDIAGYEWFSNYVGFTQRRGMMEGYPTGNFEPNQNMTRAEFATMIARFIGLSPYGTSSERHSDVSGHWSEGYINALTIARPESINGFPDGTFRPDATITRAEAVSIINRVLGRRVDTEGLTNVDHLRFQDSTGHWAYYYIVKASNSHSYQRNLSGNRANWTRVWQDIWWRS